MDREDGRRLVQLLEERGQARCHDRVRRRTHRGHRGSPLPRPRRSDDEESHPLPHRADADAEGRRPHGVAPRSVRPGGHATHAGQLGHEPQTGQATQSNERREHPRQEDSDGLQSSLNIRLLLFLWFHLILANSKYPQQRHLSHSSPLSPFHYMQYYIPAPKLPRG